MKLTQAQIATLQAALRDYADKTEGRSYGHPESEFWKEECAIASDLLITLDLALSIEVESVNLEPAKESPANESCGDINCDGQCPAEGAPKPELQRCRPALLNAIEDAVSVRDRCEILRCSSKPEKRALARFLNIPTNDLMSWATNPHLQAA